MRPASKRGSVLVIVALAAFVALPFTSRAEDDEEFEADPDLETDPGLDRVLDPTPPWERRATGGVKSFTPLLETRKRQLVSSYYLYRGPAPTEAEMDAAIGSIDRLILQDYSLEDIWSTIFNILISEPDLAHKPFENVVPPNIQKASLWRETAAPVRVVIEERYPEYAFEYRQVQKRKRALSWGGAGAFMPAYTLSIAFGSAQVGSFYDQARDQDADFSTAAAFLPVIPILGPILTQSWMDTQASNLNNPSYDAGAHLVGAVWGTLIQTLGATAMIIGISTKLPAPFAVEGDSTGAQVASRTQPSRVQVGISAGPGSAGLTMRW
jgi:hypothetical protein